MSNHSVHTSSPQGGNESPVTGNETLNTGNETLNTGNETLNTGNETLNTGNKTPIASPSTADVEADAAKHDGEKGQIDGHTSGKPSPSSPPALTNFWAPELAAMRNTYFIDLAKSMLLVTIVIWTCWALYWGSLFMQYPNTHKLRGWVINRDANGAIGQGVSSQLQVISSGALGTPHITWDQIDPALYTDEQLQHEVAVEESTWGVIVIAPDATARLEAARQNGDASWNPTSVVTLIYSEARNQQAVPGIVVSSTQSLLSPYLSTLSAQFAAEYLSANSGNATAIDLLVQAPATLSGSVALGLQNLRPYAGANPYNGAILGATYVGLIYMTIATFNVVMSNFAFRMGISSRLTLSSLIQMRILIPLVIYVWLSLMFTLLQAAFHLDFNGWQRGYGAGFMTFWMISWSAMAALGMMLECWFSMVGPGFIAFALVFTIITNVSGALLPLELSPGFYMYSLAMPYYNVKTAFLIIFCNAGKHILLLRYVGILWAWLALCLITFPGWIWLERRKASKGGAQGKRPGGPPE